MTTVKLGVVLNWHVANNLQLFFCREKMGESEAQGGGAYLTVYTFLSLFPLHTLLFFVSFYLSCYVIENARHSYNLDMFPSANIGGPRVEITAPVTNIFSLQCAFYEGMEETNAFVSPVCRFIEGARASTFPEVSVWWPQLHQQKLFNTSFAWKCYCACMSKYFPDQYPWPQTVRASHFFRSAATLLAFPTLSVYTTELAMRCNIQAVLFWQTPSGTQAPSLECGGMYALPWNKKNIILWMSLCLENSVAESKLRFFVMCQLAPLTSKNVFLKLITLSYVYMKCTPAYCITKCI